MNYYDIGQRIRRLRKAQGFSQEQLAELIGISTTHMSHIETGNTKLSLPVLVSLAVALHASTDELLFSEYGNQKQIALNDIQIVLEGCSPQQTKMIAEIVRSIKIAIDKYALKHWIFAFQCFLISFNRSTNLQASLHIFQHLR